LEQLVSQRSPRMRRWVRLAPLGQSPRLQLALQRLLQWEYSESPQPRQQLPSQLPRVG